MGDVKRVLVDTNVLLEDPAVLVRIRQRGGLPFLTSTVLDELDFNKDINKRAKKPTNKADAQRAAENARNAQFIFREFNSAASSRLTALPTGEPLIEGDVLTRVGFKDGPVFLVGREEFRSRSNNDAKIIELAKDYKMVLITRDKGMKVRAEALGVDVALWTGPEESRQRRDAPNGGPQAQQGNSGYPPRSGASTSGPKPFAICTSPINEADAPLRVGKIPEAGDPVRLVSGHEFHLGALISAGGEGSIYETQLAGQVCKIYHQNRLTSLKKRKIELMVSRRIDRPGICWPTEVVTDRTGEFVGYLMPRAAGTTIQKAMFVKPVLEKTYPNWKRRDLVNVAGTFLDHISYLHGLNIIVGDINPLNLLVTEDSTRLWMVDTDSFQIENFPCPVGTINFTPPEIQGRNYAEFLRTKDHELFAVATMIFMILFPGKPPYSQQGGGTPADNIKSKNFPYPFGRESAKSGQASTPTNAPQGTWQFIWGNLPYRVRDAFYATFREDKRASIDEWTDLLIDYRTQLEQGYQSDELFPLQFKIRDPISVSCAECSVSFTSSQRWVEKLRAEGNPVWCPECAHQIRLKRLAAKSRRATVEATGQSTVFGRGSSSSTQSWRTSAQAPSWQRPGATQGSARAHQPSSTKRPTGSSHGILSAILRFIFK
jgi:serine/threonine protein kinase